MADLVGNKFTFYPRIFGDDLKSFVHSPPLRFVLLKMFGTAVIIGGKQIVLGSFPLKVELQGVAKTFGNPDREGVTGFASAI